MSIIGIHKIVSGGQTGADRAALDTGLELGIDVGGFVPHNRMAEDGVISFIYPNLIETTSDDPRLRTEENVANSDATLIVSHGPLIGGTAYTQEMVQKHNKPFLHIDFYKTDQNKSVEMVKAWMRSSEIKTLNVAGPRRSEDRSIYENTKRLLLDALQSA